MTIPVPFSAGAHAFSDTDVVEIPLPIDILANDIIFIQIMSHQPNGIGAIDIPTGWNQITQGTYVNFSNIAAGRAAFLWKRMVGGEIGNVLFSRSGDTGADSLFHGQAYIIRGCEPAGDPFESFTPQYGIAGTSNVTFNAVAVTNVEQTLLAFCIQADDGVFNGTPAGYELTAFSGTTSVGVGGQTKLNWKPDVSADGAILVANGHGLGWATLHVSLLTGIVTGERVDLTPALLYLYASYPPEPLDILSADTESEPGMFVEGAVTPTYAGDQACVEVVAEFDVPLLVEMVPEEC